MFRWFFIFTLLLATVPLGPGSAFASPKRDVLPGPLAGEVVEVLDGDTLSVRVKVWIGQEVETSVRLAGIDAPEIHGKCEREREMAQAARSELVRLSGQRITLTNIRLEKYAGRVMAEAKTPAGDDIAQVLMEKGLARPYGGEKRKGWCG